MKLLDRYPEYIYADAAKFYLQHLFTGKDYYIPGENNGAAGTQMCNAIVEYAIHNRYPDWSAEDAIANMTPRLFFDLGLTPLLRGNDKRQKLFCPPFLLIDGKTAFPGDEVRCKARFSAINMSFVMQWVFGKGPDWKDVIRYYYDYLQNKRRQMSKPGEFRCSRYIYTNWWFEGKDYTDHDRNDNAMLVMDLFLNDLERSGSIRLGSFEEDPEKYQRDIYTFFALNGNRELNDRGLGTYNKIYSGNDVLSYIHQYLAQKEMGNFLICEQVRLDAAAKALRRMSAEA